MSKSPLLRETPRSLSAYFIILGIFDLIGSLRIIELILYRPGPPVTSALAYPIIIASLSSFAMGLAYLIVGVRLKKYLVTSPQIPLRFAYFATGLSVLSFSIAGFISFFINLYIIYQLKRMATETVEVTESRILS